MKQNSSKFIDFISLSTHFECCLNDFQYDHKELFLLFLKLHLPNTTSDYFRVTVIIGCPYTTIPCDFVKFDVHIHAQTIRTDSNRIRRTLSSNITFARGLVSIVSATIINYMNTVAAQCVLCQLTLAHCCIYNLDTRLLNRLDTLDMRHTRG